MARDPTSAPKVARAGHAAAWAEDARRTRRGGREGAKEGRSRGFPPDYHRLFYPRRRFVRPVLQFVPFVLGDLGWRRRNSSSNSWQLRFLAGSQVFSVCSYPFHLIRYCSCFPANLRSRISSTSYTSSSFSGWSSAFVASGVFPFASSNNDMWNTRCSRDSLGSYSL